MKPIDYLLDSVEWKYHSTEPADKSLPYAIAEGVLMIGSFKLRCYQLNDGSRIFDAADVHALFGVSSADPASASERAI